MQSSRPPKGNSLHKNTSCDVQIAKIGLPVVFCTADPFTQSTKPYASQCFSITHTPKSATFHEESTPHVIHVQHPKLHLDWFSHFSQLTAQCPYILQRS